MHPSIDHSLISPNGKMSKRAREQATKREAERLFPPGFWDAPAKTVEQESAEQKASDLRSAANLRDLAARGMSPSKFLKAAEALEARWS